ncbi:PAS domain-containing sensor histidine kinase [Thermodesulfobacteriota bacterium]
MDPLIVNSVLESISDSVVVLGHEGEVLYANRVTEGVLGYSQSELKEKGVESLMFGNGENHDFKQIFVDTVWDKSTNQYREIDYVHPDGSEKRLAATTCYLLHSGESETSFEGFVALFKDITEVHTLRREERRLIEEKERLAREKELSLRKLAMGVAHEIRNPVVSVGGFAARILRHNSHHPDTLRSAENILENARRLELMVNEIQQYCNIPQAKLEQTDIVLVMNEIAAEAATKGRSKNIAVRFLNSVEDGCIATLDPGLIKQAIGELVENAIDFSQEASQIDLVLRFTTDTAVIEVKDCGIGISEFDLPYIFDPFFSTQTTCTGMGLAIVERIVQEHSGEVQIESQRGVGTTMRILLSVQ